MTNSDPFTDKAAEIVALRFGYFDHKLEDAIASALREARAQEREACARLVSELFDRYCEGAQVNYDEANALRIAAYAIRARSEPQEAPEASDPTM